MPLAPDPDLEPVPAAKAAMAAMAAMAAEAEAANTRHQEQESGLEQAGRRSEPRPTITPADRSRWEITVALRYPLIVDGVELSSLTLRRLSAKALMDIIMVDDREESVNRRARAAIAGIHPDVLDALDADDAVEVADAIRPFLPRALLGAEALEMDVLAAAGNLAAAQD
jgi:hypothetical protein